MRHFIRNFGEIRKMMKRGNRSQNVVRVCPICLDNTLSIEPGFLTFIVPSTYSCATCGYKGPIFAEVPVEDYSNLLNKKAEHATQNSVNVDNS